MNTIKLVLFGACCALVACSNKADTDPKAVITEKVNARWQTRMSGKGQEGLYEYLAPSLKTLVSKDVYLSKFGSMLTYQNADVEKITCDNENALSESTACTVTVTISYLVRVIGSEDMEITRPIEEKWIKEDGNWWLYDK